MKLWEKNISTAESVLEFTIGNDPMYDKLLAPYDIIGSMAHTIMLAEIGIINSDEAERLLKALSEYYPEVCKPEFKLNEDDEDVHSHLEDYLVKKVGEAGKKIHTARSRNDQVMISLQLFMKEEWRLLLKEVKQLFDTILNTAGRHKNVLIPGYTHTQVAMPSSIALWLGAYAESIANDVKIAGGIIDYIDQNPLGSAAGFGSSFPVNRERTTELAGFRDMMISSVSVQLNRGKLEASMAHGLASFAVSLSRLAADMILYMSQDMNFISFPDELTTGSSIMPHKKNPDVLELIRAHCNTIIQLPSALTGLSTNMISGYHRDFQLTKELLFPGIQKLKSCIRMMDLMVTNMHVREHILKDEKYRTIFSVEEVNKKVMKGMAFRDAYHEVAMELAEGNYRPSDMQSYSHTGSIGNPGLEMIEVKMNKSLGKIQIQPVEDIFNKMAEHAFNEQGKK